MFSSSKNEMAGRAQRLHRLPPHPSFLSLAVCPKIDRLIYLFPPPYFGVLFICIVGGGTGLVLRPSVNLFLHDSQMPSFPLAIFAVDSLR